MIKPKLKVKLYTLMLIWIVWSYKMEKTVNHLLHSIYSIFLEIIDDAG